MWGSSSWCENKMVNQKIWVFLAKSGRNVAQYDKGCQACQRHKPIQRASTKDMTLIIKP